MRSIVVSLLVVLLFSSLCVAELAKIDGKIHTNTHLNHVSALHSSTKVTLNGGERYGFLKEDGSFTISDLEPGFYFLEVSSREFVFDKYNVEVTARGVKATLATPGFNNDKIPPASFPLKIEALGKAEYFVKREGYNYMSLLTNPMFLMMGFTLLLGYGMPKMMANIDPEQMKELQQQQQQTPALPNFDVAEMMANFTSAPSSSTAGPKDSKKKAAKN